MKKTVLVVEDEPDLAQIVAYNLAREGYTTLTAANGRDALSILESRPRPDLVLLDEPTSALDEERESALLQSAVDGVIPGGGALVVVTHNPRIVLDFCSHLIVLDNGRVVESGAVPSLCGKAAHPYTRAILRLDSR